MDLKTVFISKDDSIIVNIQQLEVYIPAFFFDPAYKYATDNGETITAFSACTVGLFENGKRVDVKTIKLAQYMNFHVYDSRDGTDPNGLPCRILTYIKGQKMFDDYIIQDALNAEAFLQMVLKGKVPSTLKYTDVVPLWIKCNDMNKTKTGVPAANLELIVSLVYRNARRPSEKYSVWLNKHPEDVNGFAQSNMRQICQYTSTFAALTFEDFDSMITSSIHRTKQNIPEPPSALEEVIKL